MTRRTNRTKTPSKKVKVRRLEHGHDLPLPKYETADAAGLDLIAAVAAGSPMTIAPGTFALVPTGLAIELPPGTEAQVRPRSGLAARHGVTVLNAPGTIDADYRGEISVILINHGQTPFEIKRGDRIAQMVLAPVTRVAFVEAKALSVTARGSGGFGSTGTGAAPSSKKPAARNAVLPKAAAPKSAGIGAVTRKAPSANRRSK